MTGGGKRCPLGTVGWRVVENVARLREQQRLTYVELSARLAQAGHSIPPLGLSRIERGERRVDADDLVTLATVLSVSVHDLLGLTPSGSQSQIILSFTGEPGVLGEEFWRQLAQATRRREEDQ